MAPASRTRQTAEFRSFCSATLRLTPSGSSYREGKPPDIKACDRSQTSPNHGWPLPQLSPAGNALVITCLGTRKSHLSDQLPGNRHTVPSERRQSPCSKHRGKGNKATGQFSSVTATRKGFEREPPPRAWQEQALGSGEELPGNGAGS